MKKIRYVNVATVLKNEEGLNFAMKQMVKGRDSYQIRQVSVNDRIKIELYNEKNTISFWVDSGKEVAKDLYDFFKMYIEVEVEMRNKIMAVIETIDMIYQYIEPNQRTKNVLDSVEGVGDIEKPLSVNDGEQYLYKYSDKEIFDYLMQEAEFFESEEEVISFIFIEDEYAINDLKEMLKTALTLKTKELRNYETVGQMMLDEHEKVIMTKHGYLYADIMM